MKRPSPFFHPFPVPLQEQKKVQQSPNHPQHRRRPPPLLRPPPPRRPNAQLPAPALHPLHPPNQRRRHNRSRPRRVHQSKALSHTPSRPLKLNPIAHPLRLVPPSSQTPTQHPKHLPNPPPNSNLHHPRPRWPRRHSPPHRTLLRLPIRPHLFRHPSLGPHHLAVLPLLPRARQPLRHFLPRPPPLRAPHLRNPNLHRPPALGPRNPTHPRRPPLPPRRPRHPRPARWRPPAPEPRVPSPWNPGAGV